MKKFPIKIDLSTFFEDERKFVIVLVDPQWNSVECLQHRVEEIFDVKPVRFLTTDNLFIPQQESIEVLEFTESIKAFIPKHVLEESRRRSKQYEEEKTKIQGFDLNTELLPVEEAPIKKRKYHSLGTDHLESSTPNQSKKKRTAVLVQPISNESHEITSTNDQTSIVKDCSLDNSSIGNLTISDKTENETEPAENKLSRKRKRRGPKEKSQRNKNSDQEKNETDLITVRPEVPSSTFLSNSKSLENNSHVYFEDSTIVESTTVKHKTKVNTKADLEETLSSNVIFKCKLNEVEFGEPLIYPLQKINKKHNTRKPVISIQENIIIRPADMDISTKHSPAECIENEIVEEGTNNIEISVVNSPNRAGVPIIIENGQSDVITTERSEDRKPENEVENVSQIENSMDKNNLVSTVNNGNENHTEEDNIEGNENQSKMPHTTDECILSEEETANPIVENIKQKTPLRKCSNISDISEISMAMDGSSVIDLDDDEDVIDLSDAEDQQQLRANPNTMSSNSLNKSIHSMSIKEMLPFCTQLVGLPDLEDIVIFKFNRRAGGEKTDLSELIACRCEHINKRTKVLKLAVIDASLENDLLPQKFCYNLDESVENRFMNIKIADMFEPKVLKT